MHFKYKALRKAIVRTPLFPLEWLKTKDRILNSKYFQEGLYLASPLISHLYKKENPSAKVKNTLYKYAHRAAFRCTPYGLFAGNSIAQINTHKCEIELQDNLLYYQHLSLDFGYVRRLVSLLKFNSYISNNINYFTNESIYLIGDKYHYVEYHFIDGEDIYDHSVVERSDIIDVILEKARNGISIAYAINIIKNIDSSVSDVEAQNFIKEMIDSQLLKSDLEIEILSGCPLDNLINKLVGIGENRVSSRLSYIKNLLNSNIGICSISYKDISDKINLVLEDLGLSCDSKNLINVDLYKPVKSASISLETVTAIEKLLTLLTRIQTPIVNNRVKEFTTLYERKYEDKEMELTQVLDNEYGIGYPIRHGDVDDQSELLNDLIIPFQHTKEKNTTYNKVDCILLNKLFFCLKKNEKVVYIDDSDFEGIDYEGHFPSTIYVICSILKNNQIFIKAIGGVSSANIISRFAEGNSEIRTLVKEISTIEQNSVPDNIVFVEIAHVPDYNDGNIVCQVATRDYIIPYISNYNKYQNKIIPISDIMISVENGSIILKSKLLKKQIIPRFTSAYNYDRSQLPIIRFLYDIQCANMTDSLACRWHEILENFEYLPRIQYNNCILSRQRWILHQDEFNDSFAKNDDEWHVLINRYAEVKGIPNEIVIVESDSELYVNLIEIQDCLLLKSILVKTKKLIVEEFIYSDNESIVESDGEHYANETILFFRQNECK